MRRSTIFLGIFMLALVGALVYFNSSHYTPAGQPQLQYLAQDASSIKESFNKAAGNVRMLLLLSPT